MNGPDIFSVPRYPVKRTVQVQLLIFLVVVYLNDATSQNTRTKDYSNYTVYKVDLKTQEQTQQFLTYASDHGLDIWRDPSKQDGSTDRDADVMVSPTKRQEFLNKMMAIKARISTLIFDVQRKINETTPAQVLYRRSGLDMLNDPKYFRYSEILMLLRDLQSSYPDKVQLIDIGKTFEGRPMQVVYISTDHRKTKPAIWIDAGIHAREWIAPSVAVQAIHRLVTDPKATDLVTSLDWFILPVFNPDGYEFSHTKDRMWRKTRSKHPNSRCYGVDANRNFEFYWKVAGASSNPCSDTYAGPTFFSEPETRNVRDFLLANKDNIKLYLTYHSYGSYLLYPWGYTHELPENSDELDKIARDVNKTMVKDGSEPYKIGSSTNVLYAAAGGSDDWAKGVANISLAYTIELPGFGFGFQLPPEYIPSVTGHAFTGIREFARHIARSTNSTGLQSKPAPNRPMTSTGSTGFRPGRPKPVYSNAGAARPTGTASSTTSNGQFFPSDPNASRPSRPSPPAQASRPSQTQTFRPVYRPIQTQPSWTSQPQYILPYYDQFGNPYYPTYQFPLSNMYGIYSNNYNPLDPYYSSAYQNYPSVKGTVSNPQKETGSHSQSYDTSVQQPGTLNVNVYPDMHSGSTGYVQSSSNNNPSYVRGMSQHSTLTKSSPGMKGARPASNNMRDIEVTGSSSMNNGGPNSPSRNPSSSGSNINPNYEEIFETSPSSNTHEASYHRAMGSGSVSFPSNNEPSSHSSNTGGVSFPSQRAAPKFTMGKPDSLKSDLNVASLWE